MIDLVLEPLTSALRDSEFLKTLDALRFDGGIGLVLAGEPVRPLRKTEISELISDGNTAEDWGLVGVAEGFRPGRIRDSDIRGRVTLGRFKTSVRGPGGVTIPSGVYRSTLANCVIGHDALVRNVGLLAEFAVGQRAVVADCGQVFCTGLTTFGNGIAIPIGPQCGGRWLRPFAEITLDLAIHLTTPDEGLAGRYSDLLAVYQKRAESTVGVIGPGAFVSNVPVVKNAYLGSSAIIEAATRVENSALLSSADEPACVKDGACVLNSIVQWAAEIRGPAVVDRTVLLEHAEVDRFGKVTDSVIGPNSAIGGAEVTASLVGPFVGCHHPALLIAARWPGGRGNLGYGAAVGCNHTSRAPDQEAVLCEGLFIGLGAKFQYPVDLSHSPYSVIASGVNLPAQKLEFPFSLVRGATESIAGAPPGANVLIPGWVLSENLYSVQRSALKFRERDRSTRHTLAHDVFRPEVMALVGEALHRLQHPTVARDVYTEREIPGLGRNVLMERHRAAAIHTYTDHLERFHLLLLLERARHAVAMERGSVEDWLTISDEHVDLEKLLRLHGLLQAFGLAVEQSKARDEVRGQLVIDDYAAAHAPTRDDPVVRETWDYVRRTQEEIVEVLAAIGQHPESPQLLLATRS